MTKCFVVCWSASPESDTKNIVKFVYSEMYQEGTISTVNNPRRWKTDEKATVKYYISQSRCQCGRWPYTPPNILDILCIWHVGRGLPNDSKVDHVI